MKRFASHYLFLPEYGYLKQYAVETEKGYVVRIFPLTEEVEVTEWFPGVIALLVQDKAGLSTPSFIFNQTVLDSIPHLFTTKICSQNLVPCLFYPYNFTIMQPADSSKYKLLQ